VNEELGQVEHSRKPTMIADKKEKKKKKAHNDTCNGQEYPNSHMLKAKMEQSCCLVFTKPFVFFLFFNMLFLRKEVS